MAKRLKILSSIGAQDALSLAEQIEQILLGNGAPGAADRGAPGGL